MALNSIRAIFRLGLCLRLGSCCWGLPARGQTLNNAIGTSTINVIDTMNINIQLEICQPLQSIERVKALPVGQNQFWLLILILVYIIIYY